MTPLSHRTPPPAVVATLSALLSRVWSAAQDWARAVKQARQARAALDLQLEVLHQFHDAILRDLGLAEKRPSESAHVKPGDRPWALGLGCVDGILCRVQGGEENSSSSIG